MKHKEPERRKLKDLKKGDIVHMRIPYEENTLDYYNGYHPKEIRGRWFKDRFGDTSKPRMVIVIGHDDNNILYLPLTSRHSGFDSKHQYVLQDNSMTWKQDVDMKSYVETHSLRAVYANPEWNIECIGRIAENDMTNIMVKLGKYEIDFESKRDQRAYVSRNRESQFERQLNENGYKLTEKKDDFTEKTYKNEDGRTITKSRWGLVKYHVPLSKEEVTELVAQRENKLADDFTKAVAYITQKSANQESEAVV